MNKAKQYLYRNLHKPGCFSLKYRGKVIEVTDDYIGENVLFKVNKTGRDRVRKEKRKNVHAYAVGDCFYSYDSLGMRKYSQKTNLYSGSEMAEITYDPYSMDSFVWKDTKERIIGPVKFVNFKDGKVYGCR